MTIFKIKNRFILYCKEIGCSAVSKESKSDNDGSILVELKAPLKLLLQNMDESKMNRKKK